MFGHTPLHYAAFQGMTAAARALLELGADASLHNEQGKTALEVAEENGKHETAQPLRDPDTEGVRLRSQARDNGLADAALPPGTRLRVDPHGDGTYTRFEKKTFGANAHFVRFDGTEAEQPVQLKGLAPAAWSVLPPPTVELEFVEVTGAITTLSGVSRGWTVERLGQAIGEQRGVAPELLRLIVAEQALDNKSVAAPCLRHRCRWRDHACARGSTEQAAARRAATAAGGGMIEQGQSPGAAPAVRQRRRGGGWCCSGPPAA